MNILEKFRLAMGFDPTRNQSEYGTPQQSGYGQDVEATPPLARIDYFPSYPYRHEFNFMGSQLAFDPITETLYSDTFGYRGITPLSLQPIYDIAPPWNDVEIGK